MSFFSKIRDMFKSPFDNHTARELYICIVKQSRSPVFYEKLGVPDTPEGRFDILALHTYFVLRRLRQDHDQTSELSQGLFDLMFADIDQNLRELSIGDSGVSRRIQKMAQGFYGRIAAYNTALDQHEDDKELCETIDRNVYRQVTSSQDSIEAIAKYTRANVIAFEAQPIEDLMIGKARFAELPEVAETPTQGAGHE